MRIMDYRNRSVLIASALQRDACDLTVKNAQVVNVFTGEILNAEVDIRDGVIVRVRKEGESLDIPSRHVHDASGAYLIPGYIDTHIHVESTMMIPSNLSRAIVPLGTTTICTDPHEIANVCGIAGVDFMLEDARKSALRQFVLAPSCVPSVPGLENAGTEFGAAHIAELLERPGVIGIAELMDFVGIIQDTERMHGIIDEGLQRGVFLQGHAPLVTGRDLAAYLLGGPVSDHESGTPAEVLEKLRSGMHVNMRINRLTKNNIRLLDGMKDLRWRDNVSVCTDDIHAKDILTGGHMNRVVADMVHYGLDAVEAVRMATLHAAREYHMEDLGAIAPGYVADMQLVRTLGSGVPEAVFISGRLVAQDGRYLVEEQETAGTDCSATVNVSQLNNVEDFILRTPGNPNGQILTSVLSPNPALPLFSQLEWLELPVRDGVVDISQYPDLCYIMVANRYERQGRTIAVLRDRELRTGAYGTTISHDSHNMTILYRDASAALEVAQTLQKCGGGICVVNGSNKTVLELPVAGLMSLLPIEDLTRHIEVIERAISSVCREGTDILLPSILALACLPCPIVTDVGIFDGLTQTLIPNFA